VALYFVQLSCLVIQMTVTTQFDSNGTVQSIQFFPVPISHFFPCFIELPQINLKKGKNFTEANSIA